MAMTVTSYPRTVSESRRRAVPRWQADSGGQFYIQCIFKLVIWTRNPDRLDRMGQNGTYTHLEPLFSLYASAWYIHWHGHGINPYQNPNEIVAWSAEWKVHIWNWLRECHSRLYTGTLKTPGLQRSNFRRLKIKLKHSSLLFAIGTVFKITQSNREMCAAMPRAGRRPTVALRNPKDCLGILSKS